MSRKQWIDKREIVKNDTEKQLGKLEKINKADGWNNVLTGMGQMGSDRKESTTFAGEYRLNETLCRNLYTYSGLARSIADLPVDDSLRLWFTIEGDTDNYVLDECKRLSIIQEISRAWKWARVYGGAVIVMMANDGKLLREPLDIKNIKYVEKLKVYHRWRVSRETYYLNPNMPNYAETEIYRVAPIQPLTSSFQVHESRCLIFDGVDVAPEIRVGNQWWGDSSYQAIYSRLRGLGESWSNIEHIIGEFILMITKIKGLALKLAENKENEIIQRAMINNMTRHLMGSYMIDADGEDATRTSATTSGLGEMIEKLMMAVSAETRIPIRKLFGTPITSSGLGNNGDAETRDYYDYCVSERNNHIQLPLERLIKTIMLQKDGPFSGKEIDGWKIDWKSLYEEPMSVQLANKKIQSEIDNTYYTLGVLDPEEIRESRFGNNSYSFDTNIEEKMATEKGIDNQGNLTRSD